MRATTNYEPGVGSVREVQTIESTSLDVVAADGLPTRRKGADRNAGYESIGRSALRHPVLVGAVAVFGLFGAAAVGYKYPVTYTADAHLIVGRTSGLAEDEVPGLAAAVQGLASDYARLATTTNVISATEANLHTRSLPGSLSASPIPESSVIDVEATASSKAAALRLANAGAAALTAVVTQVTNDSQAQVKSIANAFSTEDGLYQRYTAEATQLRDELGTLLASAANRPLAPVQQGEENALQAQIAQAQTRADTAQMEAQAYTNEYNAALPPMTVQEEMVQEVGSATYSGSSKASTLEAAGLAGAVGGLIVGLAAASLLEQRMGKRQVAWPAQ